MLLSELFDQFTYGELSRLKIGGFENGEIDPSRYKEMIAHINLALTDLHKKFPLNVKELIIQQVEWIQTYYLRKEFAETNKDSTEPHKYLIDSHLDPFKNDVIKVEQVYSEYGEEYSLNDPTDTFTVYTPTFDSLTVPFHHNENSVSVIYRANHEKIIVDTGFDPDNIHVRIPVSLLEPLLLFVYGRILSNMSGTDNMNEASVYMGKYTMLCNQITDINLINKPNHSNMKLDDRGWV